MVSTQIVKQLEDRNWIEAIGHRDGPGRPALYATTRQFLDDLGLESLDRLPLLEGGAPSAEMLAGLGTEQVDLLGDQALLPLDAADDHGSADDSLPEPGPSLESPELSESAELISPPTTPPQELPQA